MAVCSGDVNEQHGWFGSSSQSAIQPVILLAWAKELRGQGIELLDLAMACWSCDRQAGHCKVEHRADGLPVLGMSGSRQSLEAAWKEAWNQIISVRK
jgi:hypothetical protein